MVTQINQYMSKIQVQKSIRNRIARASRCIPTAGKLPCGRTFNRATETWGIDKEKQKKIAWVAEQYLKGAQLRELAQTLGMNAANLWKILTRRCGDTWEVRFQSKRIVINEKVTLKIPPLLSPETIKKIHERAEVNKTYTHGMKKHEYLLARMVFCSKCGYAVFGETNHGRNRYYRHSKGQEWGCDTRLLVRADELEEAVLVRLFATLGDAAGIEAAVLKVIPDRAKIEELRERKKFLESELLKAEARKNRLIDSIADGIISKDEVTRKMEEIRARENSLKEEIDGIEPQLTHAPSEEDIRHKAELIQRMVGQIYRTPLQLRKMTFEEGRKLVSAFFSGKDAQGRRLGVYVEKKPDSGVIRYEIRGTFDQTFKGTLTPDGLDILDLPDVSVEHLEALKGAVRGKGGMFKQDIVSISQTDSNSAIMPKPMITGSMFPGVANPDTIKPNPVRIAPNVATMRRPNLS